MVDMHMHTVYSDGLLKEQEILARLLEVECMSVTDHNSVYFYKSLFNKGLVDKNLTDRIIIGSEITIENYPDCLVFFPLVSPLDVGKINSIEGLLRKIRRSEETAVQQAYEILKKTDNDVLYSDWNKDLIRMSPEEGYELEARTCDLASMRYRLRNNVEGTQKFDKEDLKVARIARRMVDYSVEYSPFQIAMESKGEIALAHPIKTAYIKAEREKGSLKAIQDNLEKIITWFYDNGGRIIEWEYIDEDVTRNPLIQINKEELRSGVLDYINRFDFKCVWGTDSHREFPKNSGSWSCETMETLGGRLPEWVRRKL